MAERPWYPGEVVAEGRSLLTDRLATWYPEYALDLTQWKSGRFYVDARDVDEGAWADHPGHAIPASKQRLRELLARAPVFALGDRPEVAASLRERGARIYEVEFSRTGGDGLAVTADGPGGRRRFFGSIHDLPFDAHEHDGVNRILDAISDGRLSERSMDLAELLGALNGDDTSLLFTEAERDEYVEVLDRSLEQVFARARERPEGGRAIVAALAEAEARGATTLADVAGLGPATLHVMEDQRLSSTVVEGRPFDGVIVEGGDGDTILLPGRRSWILEQAPEAWLPPAEEAWRARASERHRAHVVEAARRRDEEAAKRRAQRRPALIVLLLLVMVGLGWFANQVRKAMVAPRGHLDFRPGNPDRDLPGGLDLVSPSPRPPRSCRSGFIQPRDLPGGRSPGFIQAGHLPEGRLPGFIQIADLLRGRAAWMKPGFEVGGATPAAWRGPARPVSLPGCARRGPRRPPGS